MISRDDFWASTSNKQLNFLQHIFTILKQYGRAAVVLPDNVLFEGGAGETIRRELLRQADVHTLLRLPTGIFYAQGVKANVLFFDRKPAREKPWTERLWIYDLRTNKHFTLKENTLQRGDLDHFVACCHAGNRHQRTEGDRFKGFAYDELLRRDKVNLDIFWLKDEALEESANLPAPEVIAREIADDLEAALEQFATIAEDNGNRGIASVLRRGLRSRVARPALASLPGCGSLLRVGVRWCRRFAPQPPATGCEASGFREDGRRGHLGWGNPRRWCGQIGRAHV